MNPKHWREYNRKIEYPLPSLPYTVYYSSIINTDVIWLN